MSDHQRRAPRIVDFKFTAAVAQERIRAAARVTTDIVWGRHIEDRMDQRGLMRQDVLRILRTGFVDEPPMKTEFAGEWKCKITLRIRGERVAGVAVVLLPDGRLFLKTVEWEDGR